MNRLIRFEIAPKSIAVLVLTGCALWLLSRLWPILLVIVCSLILVGTLNPFVGWLEARPMRRGWALTLVFGSCALLLGLLGLVIFPTLLDQEAHLFANFPAIQVKLAGLLEVHRLTAPLAASVRNFAPFTDAAGTHTISAFKITLGVVEVMGYAMTSVVLALYFISDFDRSPANAH